MNFILYVFVSVVVAMSNLAFADSYVPLHSCAPPVIPTGSISNNEVDALNIDIESYRKCIQQFIREQNAAIDMHERAHQEAVNEWNLFVKNNKLNSLN